MRKKDYFNIPNLMGYFRILMLPVFLVLYVNADTARDYVIAFIVLGISIATDFFDGKIARKFNMITEFGKVLDPVADKLTQGVLALVLALRYRLMRLFLAIFLAKELYMGLMGLYLIRKGKGVNGAQWYGKVCTTIVNAGVVILLILPEIPLRAANAVAIVLIAAVCATMVRYLIFHLSLLKKTEE